MAAHAKLSASGSARWIACPGSVKACEDAPDTGRGSIYAQEGTAAHELAELLLASGATDCGEWLGQPLPENNAFTVTPEMAGHVETYAAHVRGVGGEQWYERRVDFSGWVPGGFGTSDCIAIKDATLHVIDLKYGKGVRVDAEDNTQGILYALGAYAEHEFTHTIDRVRVHIVQPRLGHIDEWEISVKELLSWGERIAQAAQLALSDNAPRRASEEACRWCPVQATCPVLYEHARDALSHEFDELVTAGVDKITDEQAAIALRSKRLIIGWLDAIEASVKERLDSGQGFPGFKLVAGRGTRSWIDEAQAQDVLVELLGIDGAYERKLLSVAKAEKALKKPQREQLTSLVSKSEGAPTVVPDDDPRPAIGANPEDFDF